MMYFKPVHFGFGLVFLVALASLGYSPSQGDRGVLLQADATEVNSPTSEASAVTPDAVEDTTVVPESAPDSSESVLNSSESAEGETASEPGLKPAFLQADTSIVSVAQSEISKDEWQVVESELALFYSQKNSSAERSVRRY